MASTGGESLESSTLSGHLGHRIRRQKLAVASFASSESDTLVELALVIRLDTGGQSKVPEQLGHDKRSGSQPRYLSLLHDYFTICSILQKKKLIAID